MSLSRRALLLRFILRSHEARLVHIHFLWNAAWFFDLWRKPTIPVLVTAHGSDVNNAFEDPRYGGRVRRALGAADAVVCVSRFIKERLMALGCPEDKLIVNPLGVPIPKIDACRREGRDRTSSSISLICVAALREEKGHRYLLEAVRKVRDSHPDVRLELAGDGPLRGPILRQIRAMGLDGCVRLLGWRSEEEVFSLMAGSDICVQPSVLHVVKGECHREEGLPLSLVEAAAVGLPIVGLGNNRVGGNQNMGATAEMKRCVNQESGNLKTLLPYCPDGKVLDPDRDPDAGFSCVDNTATPQTCKGKKGTAMYETERNHCTQILKGSYSESFCGCETSKQVTSGVKCEALIGCICKDGNKNPHQISNGTYCGKAPVSQTQNTTPPSDQPTDKTYTVAECEAIHKDTTQKITCLGRRRLHFSRNSAHCN